MHYLPEKKINKNDNNVETLIECESDNQKMILLNTRKEVSQLKKVVNKITKWFYQISINSHKLL